MSQHTAWLITPCSACLSFLNPRKLSGAGRGWHDLQAPRAPEGTPAQAPILFSAPQCSPQNTLRRKAQRSPLLCQQQGQLLCLLFPDGKTYSQEFTENTTRIIRIASSQSPKAAGSVEKAMLGRKKSNLTAELLDARQKSELLQRNFWRYLSPG